MTQLVFWDVDTLFDFMRPEGRLYVPGSEEIIPALEALTAFAHAHRIPIVASAHNHDSADAEISEATGRPRSRRTAYAAPTGS